MPDTLKQFYNATINITGLTGNQTAQLFANNATTRAVIKDVAVNNTFPAVPNLTINGTNVATLSASVSGSEIVDVSQSVGISFASPLVLSTTTRAYFSPVSGQRVEALHNINGTQSSATSVDQNLPSTEGVVSFVIAVYHAPDGDVFSIQTDGGANWFLCKNAGSAGGTRTTINTGNTDNFTPIAFDGVNTFYWHSSTTNLRAFNADTETTTNITTDANDTTLNMSRLVFSNGYLLYQTGQNRFLHIIEVSTGRWFRFTGANAGGTWNQTSGMVGFWFEPSTRVATVMWYISASPTAYIRVVSPPIPAFTATSQNISTAWSYAQLTAAGFANRSAATSNVTISLSSADGGVMLDSSNFACILSGLATMSCTLTLLNSPASVFWRPRASTSFSPTVNTTNFPNTISLRVTGVEITP